MQRVPIPIHGGAFWQCNVSPCPYMGCLLAVRSVPMPIYTHAHIHHCTTSPVINGLLCHLSPRGQPRSKNTVKWQIMSLVGRSFRLLWTGTQAPRCSWSLPWVSVCAHISVFRSCAPTSSSAT